MWQKMNGCFIMVRYKEVNQMNLIERKQLKNQIERVLHVPGNYQGGILEMAVVIDMSLSKEQASERAKELVSTLKSHSEVFRNVRLNTILWKDEDEFIKEVTPLAMLQMGRFFEKYETHPVQKNWDGLLATLKKFYARSKLIIVLTDETAINATAEETGMPFISVGNKADAKESMQPFLHKKVIVQVGNGEAGQEKASADSRPLKIMSGTEIFMSLIR